MRRTRPSLELAGLIAWLGISLPLMAQAPGTKPATNGNEAAPATEGDDSSRKPESEEGQARRMIGVLNKLHAKMEAKLKLTTEQKRTIKDLFDNHIKSLKVQGQKPASDGEKGENDEEMSRLKEKMKEAQQNADRDGVNEARNEIRELRRERRAGIQKNTSQFLKKVEEKLDESQKEPFQEMVAEFGLDMDAESADVSVQQLFRAVLSPEVGLSREQQVAVLGHMRTAIESMDAETKESRDLDELSGQLRADVRQQLTPEQWTKVEEMLKPEVEKNKAERARAAERKKSQGEKKTDD